MKTLSRILGLLSICIVVGTATSQAQPVPATTAFTRNWLRSTDAATAQNALRVGVGQNLVATITNLTTGTNFWFVDPTNVNASASGVKGTVTAPFLSISNVIPSLSSNDVIYVGNGTDWLQGVTLPMGVAIIGNGAANTYLALGAVGNGPILNLNTNNFLANLTFLITNNTSAIQVPVSIAAASGVTGITLWGCRIITYTDMFNTGSNPQISMWYCFVHDEWDLIRALTAGTDFRMHYCTFDFGIDSIGPEENRLTISTKGNYLWDNCTFIFRNGSSSANTNFGSGFFRGGSTAVDCTNYFINPTIINTTTNPLFGASSNGKYYWLPAIPTNSIVPGSTKLTNYLMAPFYPVSVPSAVYANGTNGYTFQP